jgi:protein-tyrosine phosphatase
MIDIHCHILPAIDDGAEDIQTSLEMLRIAAADGITHIVASPHYRHGESPAIDIIQRKIKQVRDAMKGKAIEVELLEGADIRLTYELLRGIEKKEIPSINGSRYFLLELPDLVPPHLDEFLLEMKGKGFVPIITHPERNYSLLSTPEKTDALRNAGAMFQVTAMSVTGDFGRQIRNFTRQLFKKGYVDFVATDAHDTRRRPPLLSKAYQETVDLLKKAETDRIFFENPKAVIEDRSFHKWYMR